MSLVADQLAGVHLVPRSLKTVAQSQEWCTARTDLHPLQVKKILGQLRPEENKPLFLWGLYESLPSWQQRSVVGPMVMVTWCTTEFPQSALDDARWKALFDLSGYYSDWLKAARPVDPVRLYRGSTEADRLGWAWTSDPAVAAGYAFDRIAGRERGQVWTADFDPWRLRSHYEAEYVVDTLGLEANQYDASHLVHLSARMQPGESVDMLGLVYTGPGSTPDVLNFRLQRGSKWPISLTEKQFRAVRDDMLARARRWAQA